MEPASLALAIAPVLTGCAKLVTLCHDAQRKYQAALSTLESIIAECDGVYLILVEIQYLSVHDMTCLDVDQRKRFSDGIHDLTLACTRDLSIIQKNIQDFCQATDEDVGPTRRLGRRDKMKLLWNGAEIDELLQRLRGYQTNLTARLSILKIHFDKDMRQMVEMQGTALTTLVERSHNRKYRDKYVSQATQSVLEVSSIASAGSSTISDTSFQFDNEALNSRAYRQAFKRRIQKHTPLPSIPQESIDDASVPAIRSLGLSSAPTVDTPDNPSAATQTRTNSVPGTRQLVKSPIGVLADTDGEYEQRTDPNPPSKLGHLGRSSGKANVQSRIDLTRPPVWDPMKTATCDTDDNASSSSGSDADSTETQPATTVRDTGSTKHKRRSPVFASWGRHLLKARSHQPRKVAKHQAVPKWIRTKHLRLQYSGRSGTHQTGCRWALGTKSGIKKEIRRIYGRMRSPRRFPLIAIYDHGVLSSTIFTMYGMGMLHVSLLEDEEKVRRFLHSKMAILLLYTAIGRESHYGDVRCRWAPAVKRHGPGVPFIIIGIDRGEDQDGSDSSEENADLTSGDSLRYGQRLAQEVGALGYLECDLLTRQGVDDFFKELHSIWRPDPNRTTSADQIVREHGQALNAVITPSTVSERYLLKAAKHLNAPKHRDRGG